MSERVKMDEWECGKEQGLSCKVKSKESISLCGYVYSVGFCKLYCAYELLPTVLVFTGAFICTEEKWLQTQTDLHFLCSYLLKCVVFVCRCKT